MLFSSLDIFYRDWIKAQGSPQLPVYDSLKCSFASDQAVRGLDHTLGLQACPSALTPQLEAPLGA